ncbi:VC0807 family protein [Streptomyces sp. NPDC001339]|uniref:VC0807 family protein n=1 Tax=Streptomyces sp. NPDC001339 TaxID=3364563 RepID=UPI003699AD81
MSQNSRNSQNSQNQARALMQSFAPLIVDAGIPIASFYVLSEGFGLSTVAALGWSSVVPALRTVWDLVRSRGVNGLALLMLIVNGVGLAMSAVAGDARLMMAKDSAVSSVVGLTILLSLRTRRPLMTAGLKPWVTKGSTAGHEAWDRLIAGCERFRRAERRFSAMWGSALLTECVLKVIGAYTLPVHTMVWLGPVLTAVAVLLAMFIAGGSCADPMEKMVKAEMERATGGRPQGEKAGAVAAAAATGETAVVATRETAAVATGATAG